MYRENEEKEGKSMKKHLNILRKGFDKLFFESVKIAIFMLLITIKSHMFYFYYENYKNKHLIVALLIKRSISLCKYC